MCSYVHFNELSMHQNITSKMIYSIKYDPLFHYSIIFIMVATDMLTLDFKHIKSNVVSTMNLSKLYLLIFLCL